MLFFVSLRPTGCDPQIHLQDEIQAGNCSIRSVMHKAFIETESRLENQARTSRMFGSKAYMNLLREVFFTQFKLKVHCFQE